MNKRGKAINKKVVKLIIDHVYVHRTIKALPFYISNINLQKIQISKKYNFIYILIKKSHIISSAGNPVRCVSLVASALS